MKTRFILLKTVLMVLAISVTSCTKEGPEGPIGPAGQNGINGTSGTDGVDGNANVQAFEFEMTEFTGHVYNQSIPELTQEVLDNDVVLAYIKKPSNIFYPIPSTKLVISGRYLDIKVAMLPGIYTLEFYLPGGVIGFAGIPVGSIESLRIIIIESTTTITGKSNEIGILERLKVDGIDVNDYYAVMDYFGLDY